MSNKNNNNNVSSSLGSNDLLLQRLLDLQNERDDINIRSQEIKERLESENNILKEQLNYYREKANNAITDREKIKDEYNNFQLECNIKEKNAIDKTVDTLNEQFKIREIELCDTIDQLSNQLKQYDSLHDENEMLSFNIDELKRKLKHKEEEYNQDLYDMKKTLLAENDRLRDEIQKLNSERDGMLTRNTTHTTHTSEEKEYERRRLRKELTFHEHTTDTLQQQNDQLRSQMKRIQMEYELIQQKEKLYAQRGVKQKRIIDELRNKVSSLERALNRTLFEMNSKENTLRSQYDEEILELRQERNIYQHSLEKTKLTLNKLKKLSKTILQQRSEIEQFFLEALEQVKEEIRESRKDKNKKQSIFNDNNRSNTNDDSDNISINRKVYLDDLSADDRKRVLEFLFSKLNGIEPEIHELPPHSFDNSIENNDTQILLIEDGSSTAQHEDMDDIYQKGETFITD